MRPLARLGLVVLAGLAGAAPGRADVSIRAPLVRIRIGSPPAVPVAPPPAPVDPGAPPPVPVEPAPAPRIVTPAPVAVPVLTLAQFAATFRPLPGNYEVVFRHPVTCCPVKVCFTLPPGCPRKVKVHRREIVFVYPGHRVSIRFVHNGSVRVRN